MTNRHRTDNQQSYDYGGLSLDGAVLLGLDQAVEEYYVVHGGRQQAGPPLLYDPTGDGE